MAQLATRKKTTAKAKVAKSNGKTKNKAGGLAFTIEDPAQYLLATIGSSFFSEPKYYGQDENPEDIKEAGFNTTGLDQEATKIINACIQVAEGDNPRDLLALAHWARKEMNIRTTPCVMVAAAAKCQGTKPFVKGYIPRVAQRPDDILQIEAAFDHLFKQRRVLLSGSAKKIEKEYAMPACLKKGLAAAIAKVNEYGFMKYGNNGHPNWKDLLLFVERKAGYPVSKEIFEFIVNGKILDPKKTPVFAARQELNSRKKWTDSVPELARKAQVTWEVLVSQFGSRPEVWQAVLPMMGYMAIMRNMANFLDAGLSVDEIKAVAAKISSREQVLKSKQLPFRFLTAHRMLVGRSFGGADFDGKAKHERNKWGKRQIDILAGALEEAMDISVENIPLLPGVTCIAIDNSGSMSSGKVSSMSTVCVADVANSLGAMIHKKCEESYVASFGDNAVWPRLSKKDSIITNIDKIAHFEENHRGHSTYAFKVFKYLTEKKIKVDRIILLSDMQCYHEGAYSMSSLYGVGESVARYLEEYRRKVNKKCYLHSFNLTDEGKSQTPSGDPLTNVVAGFSEKVFNHILAFEGIEESKTESGKVVQLPTLEYIRANY